MNSRLVYCEDALTWLSNRELLHGCSLVSSLPDISEFTGYTLPMWKEWFVNTSKLVLRKCPDEGVTIFFQSDIKLDGVWVDKGYLCQKAAEELGFELLWHKIFCRTPIGTITFGRPAYSHAICFSRKVKADPSKSTLDVIPYLGEKTWQRGMGLEAALMISKFIATEVKSKTIVNPFCGEGSVLAAANALELDAIGIERSPKRAERAKILQISSDLKSWA